VAGWHRQRACGPLLSRPLPASQVRLRSVFLCSPPRARRLQVAKRACVLGAGVHVGQARDFVFVEVAPHAPVASRWRMRCLWYAVASLSCHPRTTWRAGGVARCVTCEQEHGGLCVLTGRLSPDGLNSNPEKRRIDRAHHDVQGPRGKRAYWLDPAWGSNRPPPSPAIQPTPAPAHPIGLFWKRQEHPSPPPLRSRGVGIPDPGNGQRGLVTGAGWGPRQGSAPV
jgi:hypothetical protein